MPEWLELILRWLQDSALGDAVRSTPFMYPTLESLHILGIAVLVGPAFAFDLRLLGVARSLVSVTRSARYLLPVSHLGLAVAVVTGILSPYIDGELDTVETSNWHAKVGRKDYMVGMNLTGLGVDDPDVWLNGLGWETATWVAGDPAVSYGRWPYGYIPKGTPGVPRTFLTHAWKRDLTALPAAASGTARAPR